MQEIAETVTSSRGSTQQAFPRARLFESVVCMGAALSPQALYLLVVQQIEADGGKFCPHQHTDLTLAAACFFTRAVLYSKCGADLPVVTDAVKNALRLINAAIALWRHKYFGDSRHALESAEDLAPAVLLRLARTHDFARLPTPDLMVYLRSELTFGANLSPAQRAAREDGYVRSAYLSPRSPAVSLRSLSALVSSDGGDADDGASLDILDRIASAEDVAERAESVDDVMLYLSRRLCVALPALKRLMPAVLLSFEGVLLACTVSDTLLTADARVQSAAKKIACCAKKIVSCLDDGADEKAEPVLRAMHQLVLRVLAVCGVRSCSRAPFLEVAEIRRRVYAEHADVATTLIPHYVVWSTLGENYA